MIGAGIFGVPAEAARLTGIYSPALFLLCGLLMTPIVLSFAEVSSYFRGTGGPILYTSTAFGALVGFESGWALYVARLTAFAANINLLLSSVSYFWVGADRGALRLVLLLLICASLTWVNVVGARQAMRSLGALTVLKFLPLLLLVAFGLSHLGRAAVSVAETPIPSYSSAGEAVLLLIYAYVGFESALIPAGEARNPARDMPRALLWGLGIVTLLYVSVQAVSVAILPGLAETKRPLVEVGAALLGAPGALLLTAGVVVSVGGNVAATMFAAPRMTYMLAREKSLPEWFGFVHPRFHTPSRSVIFFGAAAFALAATGSFVWLAGVSVLTRILLYMACVGAAPRLRRRFGDAPDRLRLPGGWGIPAAAFLVCGWLLTQVRLHAVLVSALFLAGGTALYFVAGWSRRSRVRQEAG